MAEQRAACSNGTKRRRHPAVRPPCRLLAKPNQAAQPQLLAAPIRPTVAPVRPTIARRRSQEDLRVHRVLESMKRSASDDELSRQKVHSVRVGATKTPATVRTMPFNVEQDVRQAEADVSKLMAEMATLAQ